MKSLLTNAHEYFQFDRALPAALVLLILWTWESLSPHFGGRKLRTRHAALNLSLAAINGVVLFFTLGLATTLLSNWDTKNQIGLLHWMALGWTWQLAFGFLILDLWAYVWHRTNHWSSFLWRFHRLHHSDYEMDCTTSSRFHFGELAIAATTRLPVIAAFGLAPTTILVHETALVAVSQFHHANIRLRRWDRLLRWLLVTPCMHRIHHSRQISQTNSNYASVLSFWDRVFKSFVSPEKVDDIELGLSEFVDGKWHSVTRMLMMPLATVPAKHAEGSDKSVGSSSGLGA